MRPLALALALLASPAFAGPPPGPAGGPPPDAPMIERIMAKEQEILARVEAVDPDRYARLLVLKEKDPPAYVRAMVRVARFMHRMRHGEPSEALRDKMESLQALRQRHPDGLDDLPRAERREVEAEVRALAEAIFDLRQEERRARIEEMREALGELEADVAERDAERRARIDTFVERFLEGPVDL